MLAVSFSFLHLSLHLPKQGMTFDFPVTPTFLYKDSSCSSQGGQGAKAAALVWLWLLPTSHNMMTDLALHTTETPRAWKREVDVDELDQNGAKCKKTPTKTRARNAPCHSQHLQDNQSFHASTFPTALTVVSAACHISEGGVGKSEREDHNQALNLALQQLH